MAFSLDDLKPPDDLDPNKTESLDAGTASRLKQGQEAAKLIGLLLDKYKQADFVNLALAGKPTKAEGTRDKIIVELALSFNKDLYYKAFLPEAKKLFEQVAELARKEYYRDPAAVEALRQLQSGSVSVKSSIYEKYAESGFTVILPDAKNSFSYNGYTLTEETLSAVHKTTYTRLRKLPVRIRFLNGDNDELFRNDGSIILTAFRNFDLRRNRLTFFPSLLFGNGKECLKGNVNWEIMMPEELMTEVKALKVEMLDIAGDANKPEEIEITLAGNVSMTFQPIPAGSFVMGSPEAENGRERERERER
jgi:hypothetical protein